VGARETEQGPQTRRYDYLAGVNDHPGNRGMYPDNSPGSLGPDQWQLLINTILRNGDIRERAGQVAFNAAPIHAVDASILALVDFQLGTPHKLWVAGDGCPGRSPTIGAYVGTFDPDQSSLFEPDVYYQTATRDRVVMRPAFDRMYLGVDNVLRVLALAPKIWGQVTLNSSGPDQDDIIQTFTGFNYISALGIFDAQLFAALENGGASKIVTYDTLTIRDDLTGIKEIAQFGLYRELLLAGHKYGAETFIRVRQLGTSPGTWSTISSGGVAIGMFDEGLSYKDRFYFADGNDSVWVTDATTLTRLAPATTGIAAGSIVTSVCNAFGYLFVAYTGGGGAGVGGKLARFDGTTWVPIHKDFRAQIANNRSVSLLRFLKGRLVVVAVAEDLLTAERFYESPEDATTGTWSEDAAGSTASIHEAVVF
jgi:hypothetical protein